MQHDLAEQLSKDGIVKDKFQVNVDITPISTTDPETININNDSVLTFSIDGENGMCVLPERTFLEKVFPLHEEFSKPKELIRVERMLRHTIYFIQQLLTSFLQTPL